jgi:hypothetical protein
MPKGKSGKATMAVNHIKKLYTIEALAQQAENAEAAKSNELIPYDYLVKLFEELSRRKESDDMEELFPWNIKLINK